MDFLYSYSAVLSEFRYNFCIVFYRFIDLNQTMIETSFEAMEKKPLNLEALKRDFAFLITNADSTVIPNFVYWIDQQISFYKKNGCLQIFTDHSHSLKNLTDKSKSTRKCHGSISSIEKQKIDIKDIQHAKSSAVNPFVSRDCKSENSWYLISKDSAVYPCPPSISSLVLSPDTSLPVNLSIESSILHAQNKNKTDALDSQNTSLQLSSGQNLSFYPQSVEKTNKNSVEEIHNNKQHNGTKKPKTKLNRLKPITPKASYSLGNVSIHNEVVKQKKICQSISLPQKSWSQLKDKLTQPKYTTTMMLSCPVCSKSFSHNSSYNRHMKLHRGIYSHICAVCGRKFTRKEHFTRHKCDRRPNIASRCKDSLSTDDSNIDSIKIEFPPLSDTEKLQTSVSISENMLILPCSQNNLTVSTEIKSQQKVFDEKLFSRRKSKTPKRVNPAFNSLTVDNDSVLEGIEYSYDASSSIKSINSAQEHISLTVY